jgi:hypothetical protein
MKSIERRFRKEEKDNPNLGDYIVFAKAIAGQGFSQDRLARAFNKLVPTDDYDTKDKKALMEHLNLLNGFPKRQKTGLNRTKNKGLEPDRGVPKAKEDISIK